MHKMLNKAWEKRNSKKGFTLVELIVVLVILAILAAMMIPSLIGWINKAREKQGILEARNAYLATQEVAFEEYAATGTYALTASKLAVSKINKLATGTAAAADFGKIASVSFNNDGTISKFVYVTAGTTNNWTITYSDGQWTSAQGDTTKEGTLGTE